jgi:hypothetical protein
MNTDSTGNMMPDVAQKSSWDYAIGSKESTRFIQNCVGDCNKGSGASHRNCSRYVDSLLPTRVLDVRKGQVRLHDSGGALGKYCTLSYRWGPPKFNYKTTRSNMVRMKTSVPWEKIPLLIKDAIIVTRQLDVPYLWVDALCIIQEDKTGGHKTHWYECPNNSSRLGARMPTNGFLLPECLCDTLSIFR